MDASVASAVAEAPGHMVAPPVSTVANPLAAIATALVAGAAAVFHCFLRALLLLCAVTSSSQTSRLLASARYLCVIDTSFGSKGS